MSLVLKFIPVISNYKIVRRYCDYGLYAAVWLFLIWIIYQVYLLILGFFVFFFVAVFALGAAIMHGYGRLRAKYE